MARRSQMSGRLLAVLDPDRRRRGPDRFFVLATTIVFVLLTLPLAALEADVLEPAAAERDQDEALRAEDVDLEEFKAAWREQGERMLDASHDHDAEGLAECYTRRTRLYAYGLPTIYGRDEIEENADTFWRVRVEEIELKDVEFYQVGTEVCVVGSVRAFDRRGDVLGTSRFISLYKYERGRWRIHREIVNN